MITIAEEAAKDSNCYGKKKAWPKVSSARDSHLMTCVSPRHPLAHDEALSYRVSKIASAEMSALDVM